MSYLPKCINIRQKMRYAIAFLFVASALAQVNRRTCIMDDYPYPNIRDKHHIVKCEKGYEVLEECKKGAIAIMDEKSGEGAKCVAVLN